MDITQTLAGNGTVTIVDESLETGDHRDLKLLCTVDPGFLSIAAFNSSQNKFYGLEGFHFPKPLSDAQLAQKISSLTKESALLKKVDFKNVSVQFANRRFTFLPSALFKEEDRQSCFQVNQLSRPDETIYHEPVRGLDVVNIFAVPDQLTRSVEKLFDGFSIHHHLTGLLEGARFLPSGNSGRTVLLHLHSFTIDVVVMEDRRLQFANSFDYSRTEDGIYYVMMVYNQLALDPEKTEAVIYGETGKKSPWAQEIQKYIRHVSFGERLKPVSFTYGFDELVPHYYHSVFTHSLCES